MISVPARLISAKAVLWLSGLLLISLAGNAWLVKRWLTADARCTASVAVDANKGLVEQREAEARRDQTSGDLAAEARDTADTARREAQEATESTQESISHEYRTNLPPQPAQRAPGAAGCVPLPRERVWQHLDEARRRANASAG